jgi:tetratricopeptide (TPR) repeat protein
MIKKTILALAMGTVLAAPVDAAPDRTGRPEMASDRYSACLARVEKKPDQAYEDAMTWKAEGGGGPAEHCAAVALIGVKQYDEGAARLDQLARKASSGSAGVRGQILSQAGNAWLLAGRPENAINAFTAALDLAPEDAETLIDRARALALLEKWAPAEGDLSAALVKDPSSLDAMVLRASARRAQGNIKGAEGDVTRALLMDGNYADALVEYGLIRAAKGDLSGAREAFLAVLAKAPNSTAGDSARAAIARLDIKDRKPTVAPLKPSQAGKP